MVSNWSEVMLSELTVDGKGSYGIAASAVEYDSELFTYLRITDITDDGHLNKEGLKSVDDPNAYKYVLKKNDIVFARTGNSTGRSYFYDGTDGEFVYAGFLIKFSLDPTKVNPKFLRYYTLTEEYKGWVKSFSTGSTRGNINAQTYASMKIKLPPRSHQNLIVKILDSLDEKMLFNQRIIKTLEEIAASLFKYWFIHFEFPNEQGLPYRSSGGDMVGSELGDIPKGWCSEKLSTIAEIIMGQSPKGETYNIEGQGLPLVNGASDFKGGEINPSKYTTEPKKVSEKGDYIFGVRATLGNVTETHAQYAIGRGAGIARVKSLNWKEYLYFQLQNAFHNFEHTASGSVYLNISKNDLNDYKIVYPDETIINKFNEISSPIISKKELLIQENIKLRELRETLLPKLLSGEIEIPDESVVD